MVVKADGLAAGKGVIVCKDTAEALQAVERIMADEEFGATAGRRIVVEKRLDGEELSVLALVSGRTILPLPPCQDHKAVFDGDTGPNTGGMGAYCPAPVGTPKLMAELEETVFVPTVHAMKRGRFPFQGVLFAGLMLTNQGPRVLEFNCPLRRPRNAAAPDAAEDRPARPARSGRRRAARRVREEGSSGTRGRRCAWCCARGGYPGQVRDRQADHRPRRGGELPDVKVFHAGTKLDERDRVVTDGGRVLGVTALGDDLAAAKARAYEAVKLITFAGMHYRTDIADKALKARPPAPSQEPPKLPAKFRRPGTSDAGEKPAAS